MSRRVESSPRGPRADAVRRVPKSAHHQPHSQALDQFNIEKDIAAFIKKEFDKKYNPTWCVMRCVRASPMCLRGTGRFPPPSRFTDPCISIHTNRHCIVGRNFGSYVTHETKHFIYFYLGQVAILLFKSG